MSLRSEIVSGKSLFIFGRTTLILMISMGFSSDLANGQDAGGDFAGDATEVESPEVTYLKYRLELLDTSEQGVVKKKTALLAIGRQRFSYQVGSLKPKLIKEGSGMGMSMGYGGGESGYGDDMYGGSYGGESDDGGGGVKGGTASIIVYAYTMSPEAKGARSEIRLVTEPLNNSKDAGGMGAGAGYGGGGYGGEGMYGGLAMGMGMGGGMGPAVPQFVTFESIVGKDLDLGSQASHVTQKEYEIVASTIKQRVWKDALVEKIKQRAQDAEFISNAEPKLKELLAEQYTTQLERQRMEVGKIEAKVKQLKLELARRESAMSRVVEIQTGKIVLEAQGLLQN